MKALTDRARVVLDRYKATQGLADEEKARLLDILERRALRGDLPRFDVAALSRAAPSTNPLQRLWMSPLGKLGLVLALVGPAAFGVYTLSRAEPRSLSKAPVLSATLPPSVTLPPSATSSPTRPRLGAAAGPPAMSGSTASVKPERAPQVAGSDQATVDEEVQLVSAAQTALRSGNPERALRLLAEDAARFPRGKLTSAREVTHMMALCKLGRTDQARLEAARFLAKNAQSPFADRVRSICSPPHESP
jgi:hypothetical protein